MRNEVKKGDLILVHHSSSNPPGVVGIATSNQDGHPDPTAFDPKDAHFGPGSDPETPRWIQVEHRFKPKFRRLVPRPELRKVFTSSPMPHCCRKDRSCSYRRSPGTNFKPWWPSQKPDTALKPRLWKSYNLQRVFFWKSPHDWSTSWN